MQKDRTVIKEMASTIFDARRSYLKENKNLAEEIMRKVLEIFEASNFEIPIYGVRLIENGGQIDCLVSFAEDGGSEHCFKYSEDKYSKKY